MEIFKTVHGSKRVMVYRTELPDRCQTVLDCMGAISIWGGYDQNETDFLSWELDENIPDEVIKVALSRLGCRFSK